MIVITIDWETIPDKELYLRYNRNMDCVDYMQKMKLGYGYTDYLNYTSDDGEDEQYE